MQTLFLSTSDCPDGKLPAGQRTAIDASGSTLLGVTLRKEDGVAHTDEESGETTGYDFDEAHIDCNCPVSLANARELFQRAAEALGIEPPEDAEILALIKPHLAPRKFSTMKLLVAVGTLGADKYDEAKAFMQSQRVGGVPIWDLVNTAQYIMEDDPRLIAAKELVVDGGICPEELFYQLLESALDEE